MAPRPVHRWRGSMRIRTKLVAYFLIIALLVPVLGGAALDRVRSINGNVENLSDHAIPLISQVRELQQIQMEQQSAALAYVAGGKAEDRQRYLDLDQQFNTKLDDLNTTDISAQGKQQTQS